MPWPAWSTSFSTRTSPDFKFKADAGISKYGDGEEGQFGVAWGTELFGGRGHFETSARYREQAMIPISARPYGKDGQAWLLTGNGSAANPFVNTPYARVYQQRPVRQRQLRHRLRRQRLYVQCSRAY